MSKLALDTGRSNQKIRTRRAIIEAARRVLKHNPTPSLEDIAQEAMVSRATIYRYFPTIEILLIADVLDYNPIGPDQILAGAGEDPLERLKSVNNFWYSLIEENEARMRQGLKSALSLGLEKKADEKQVRSGRRVIMIEEALKHKKEQLDQDTFRKLVLSLSVLIGLESYIALSDVCKVSNAEGKEIVEWAIAQLLNSVTDKK
jgi:AcrR family transcriptional regulator